MNHLATYQALVATRQHRVKASGLEKHHIQPRSLGGTDEPHNLVYLTPREHLLAHLLLVKTHPCSETISAAWMMTNTRDGTRIKTTRAYESLRLSFIGTRLGSKDSQETKAKKRTAQLGKTPGNAGRPSSPEKKAKQSAKLSGELNPRFGVIVSDETRQRISEATKGRVSPRKGVVVLDETKQKLAQKALTRERFVCQHCGQECTKQNLTRWHNSNCRKAQ
jgi:hypothetical protein